MIMNTRRAAFALLLACTASFALAQDFPNKRVRILVPTGAGGAPDMIARLVANQLTPVLGQPVVVENRTGGGGTPAVMEMMNSQPDGHSVLAADVGTWGVYPAVQARSPYDPVRDFAPISLVFMSGSFVVVRSSLPVNTVRELIEFARSKPGQLHFGTPGVGTLHHLAMEYVAAQSGVKVTHVPYKASAEMVDSLLRGDTQFMMNSITVMTPHIKAGNMRLLATMGQRRSKVHPDIPTIAEAAGLPGVAFPGIAGYVARVGTPRPIIDKLNAALHKALVHPEVVEKAAAAGIEMTPSTPEELTEVIRADVKKFADAVKFAGVTPQ